MSWIYSTHFNETEEAWRREYNQTRPHGALGNLAPEKFAETVGMAIWNH
jgi:transposase InsO family protein